MVLDAGSSSPSTQLLVSNSLTISIGSELNMDLNPMTNSINVSKTVFNNGSLVLSSNSGI